MPGRGSCEYLFDRLIRANRRGTARRTGRLCDRRPVASPARRDAIRTCRGCLDFVFHLTAWAQGDLRDMLGPQSQGPSNLASFPGPNILTRSDCYNCIRFSRMSSDMDVGCARSLVFRNRQLLDTVLPSLRMVDPDHHVDGRTISSLTRRCKRLAAFGLLFAGSSPCAIYSHWEAELSKVASHSLRPIAHDP